LIYAGRITEIKKTLLAVPNTKMYQFAITHIVSQLAIKPVYTILNSCNCVIHVTDMDLIIHNTVVYLTLTFHPKGESTAFRDMIVYTCFNTVAWHTYLLHIYVSKLILTKRTFEILNCLVSCVHTTSWTP
jgi:hypothetical protein